LDREFIMTPPRKEEGRIENEPKKDRVNPVSDDLEGWSIPENPQEVRRPRRVQFHHVEAKRSGIRHIIAPHRDRLEHGVPGFEHLPVGAAEVNGEIGVEVRRIDTDADWRARGGVRSNREAGRREQEPESKQP